jgi:hypothetical protein
VKKLIGRTDVEDALKRLDKLAHEEAWMGIAQSLKATHTVGESVRRVDDRVTEVIRGAQIILNQSPSHTYRTIWATQTVGK